jgi:monoamine oxidase
MAIHLNTPVREIEWAPGQVRVNGFEASHAVITLPLGVLQSNKIRFRPEIKTKTNALESLAMGSVVKVILHFDVRFWEDLGLTNLAFLHAHSESIPTWWTTQPVVAPILTGWAGGPPGEALAFKKESEVLKTALDSLARILNMRRNSLQRHLRASFVADWQTDPFSLGAYSYVPVGGFPAARKLAEPLEETLFFAGEATNTEGHSGTVHGAIATGYRAAAEILAVIKRRAA